MTRRQLRGPGPEAGEFCATAGALPPFEIVAVSPAGSWDPAIPIAASRAGATGILDLAGRRDPVATAALERLHEDGQVWTYVSAPDRLRRFFTAARARARRVGLVVTTARDLDLVELGPDVVIAKGHESGGRIGE